ncbi:hypothetical protein N0V84_012707 [Fusarium piperis]|uniref:Amidase n=1 Tax=Fusarium piperis TaxID=1435070 RepID=A0A9W8T9S2_9HYPO|nr:hypothetical protein N0V84_012707 [Fusarium piperis]
MAKLQGPDLVRLTASQLQERLQNGELTSIELVKSTLAQINRHNKQGLTLRAVISVAPEDVVVARAAQLDAKRAQGKDVIKTHSDLGMPTTLGNFGLLSAKANDSAVLMDKSAIGGQTSSAYVEGGIKREEGPIGHSPSARAGLFALKPSIGATELEGIFAVSEDFDTMGTMAKSSLDLATLTPLVLNAQARAKLPSDGYLSFLKEDFSGLKIGFIDAEN